jgi:hypothetical protein
MRSEAWRPAAAARDRSPREARDPALQALRPGCEELAVSGANAGERSAAPEPKTATVERREASVPRHGTQGASQAPGTLRYGVSNGCFAEHPNVSRRSAHPSFGVSEAKVQTPGAEMRRENGMGCLKS